jgi:hypothetical protein
LAAANEVGGKLFRPAFDAIRRANGGALSEKALADAFTVELKEVFPKAAHGASAIAAAVAALMA